MKSASQDSVQAIQRVRVGLTGLATVVVLIGVASAIFSSANRENGVSAVGAPNANVVANLTVTGNAAGAKPNEPLAEIGVTPSTSEPANSGQAATHP